VPVYNTQSIDTGLATTNVEPGYILTTAGDYTVAWRNYIYADTISYKNLLDTWAFQFIGDNLTGLRGYNMPDADGTLVLLEANNVWLNQQEFQTDVVISSGAYLYVTGGGGIEFSGAAYASLPTTVYWFNGATYSATINSSVTANRDQVIPDASGMYMLVGNSDASSGDAASGEMGYVAASNRNADIASRKLTNGTAPGKYRVTYVLADTTADVTAGAVTLTISWTDRAGATTATATQVLTGVGRQSGTVPIVLASGDITFAVSHTGLFGGAKYALDMTTEWLGP
jgi:hypothetical protein